MDQKDEMQGLLDRVVIDRHSTYIQPNTQDARNIIADWITDHPMMAGELLAGLLRHLPEVFHAILKEHLGLTAYPKTHYVGSKHITTGIRVVLNWDHVQITEAEVDI